MSHLFHLMASCVHLLLLICSQMFQLLRRLILAEENDVEDHVKAENIMGHTRWSSGADYTTCKQSAIRDTIIFDQYFGLGPSSGSIEFWCIPSTEYII